MVILDANMILRYLLNDNKEMADRSEQYLTTRKVYVTIEVIAEVVYVLKRVYSIGRKEIAKAVKNFLDLVQCQEKDMLRFALDAYGERNLDSSIVCCMGIMLLKALKSQLLIES